MKKAILAIIIVISTISSFSQSLFFDNLANTTWTATEKSKEAGITNSKEIALVKQGTSTDSLKKNSTCWHFNEGRKLLTITRFNSRWKTTYHIDTYTYQTNADKGTLAINVHGRQQEFKVENISTDNFAFLKRKKYQRSPNPILAPKANSDTFKKEIPVFDGIPDLFYTLKKQKEKQLQLDSLESGYDSLQIRIWYNYALIKDQELIVIRRTNDQWSAAHYNMVVDWDYINDKDSIETFKVTAVTPKSGWNKFMRGLDDLFITTLPDMNNIPGLIDSYTDGVGYNVEIATKKQYRFYNYHLPEEFADKFWEAKKMTQIIKLIATELKQ